MRNDEVEVSIFDRVFDIDEFEENKKLGSLRELIYSQFLIQN